MWIKENPSTLLVGMYIGVATMENSMEIPQKIKNRTTIQSCNFYTFFLFLALLHWLGPLELCCIEVMIIGIFSQPQ